MFTIHDRHQSPAFLGIVLAAGLGIILYSPDLRAAGKKKASTQAAAPSCPVQGVGSPIRPVVVQKVAGKAFPLPTGTSIDLSADVRSMIITELSGTQNLAPSESAHSSDPEGCDTPSVELRAAVSTIELNLQEYGLTIGYTPTGTHSGITSVQGETRVKVGTISMDFSLWRCNGGRCTAIAAATANQNTVDTELGFTINFGLITSGASFASHPSFNKILRKIVKSGVQQLSQSPRIAELPWSATIRETALESGVFLIDAGSQDRLSVNQKLVIYSAVPVSGVCGVFKAIAYARIERVDPISSIAVIEQTLDSREVSEGDLVMLKTQ